MMTFDDLKKLAYIDGPCLSIFQPLRDPFSQVTKSDTRLIAAAQKADEMLSSLGMAAEDRENLLSPILKLARNTDWSAHTGSIVIFRAPGFTQAAFWPDLLEADVRLGEEFYILPLIPGLAAQRDFWVLTLSINNIRLLRGTVKGIDEVELPESLPRSLVEAEGFDTPEGDLEARSTAGPSVGGMNRVRFGTGSLNETQGKYLHDFFKTIDRGIRPMLTHGNLNAPDPLILVAVPRELAIYRDVNSYTGLLAEGIHASGGALSDAELHKAALGVLARDGRAAEKAARELDTAAGRGLAVANMGELLRAAALGQVEHLYFAPAALGDGRVDATLLNEAALAVLRGAGLVYCADAVNGKGFTAVLRYRKPVAPEAEAVPAGV
jgi:hypothetical protein